ncbi:hypothetical protein LOCC1_G007301 [Lachnellula occidentalis]|uniref:DUF5672 domain-containing protein n=1 Tax=Lachnellula occidentalis TaxID=215460 RepID=A0A8H8RRU3_9HELO|nr:hypothetical protein LOCC1_G007301 [Lachnellula occidentalis]
MIFSHAGPSSKGSRSFAIDKTKILVLISLLATWTIVHLLPVYRPAIQGHIRGKYNAAIQRVPRIKVDWFPNRDPRDQFDTSKVALLIEGRPIPHLVPQLLHMITVVPNDWRFVFIGTNESVTEVSRSFATQYHMVNGKLDLMVLPEPWSIDSKEDVYRVLTDIRFYEEFLPGAEFLFKFESDSILCANSPDSLNDWISYDWAGASRSEYDGFAGNGGLSLRKVSTVKRILKFQARLNDTDAEDEWFGKRVTSIPGTKVAQGGQETHFAVEDYYYDNPLGFHVRNGGQDLADGVWKDPAQRKKIFDYCRELNIIMPMKLERERCAEDNLQGRVGTV